MIVCEKLAPVHVPYKGPHVARKFPKSSRSIGRGLPRLSGGPEHNKTVHGPRCAVCGLTCGRFVFVSLWRAVPGRRGLVRGSRSWLAVIWARCTVREPGSSNHRTRCAVHGTFAPIPGRRAGAGCTHLFGPKKSPRMAGLGSVGRLESEAHPNERVAVN